MTTSVRIAPRPGIWMPIQCSVWNDSGRSRSDASSVSKITFNTHSVMISGIQMSSPVIRYLRRALERKCFFTASEIKRPECSPGRTQCGGLSRGLGFGFLFRLRLGLRFGLRVRFGVGLGVRLLVGGLLGAALEIGGVPAGASQLKPGGRELLLVLALAASRTNGERRIRDLLEVLVLVSTGRAAVFVDRHGTRLYR